MTKSSSSNNNKSKEISGFEEPINILEKIQIFDGFELINPADEVEEYLKEILRVVDGSPEEQLKVLRRIYNVLHLNDNGKTGILERYVESTVAVEKLMTFELINKIQKIRGRAYLSYLSELLSDNPSEKNKTLEKSTGENPDFKEVRENLMKEIIFATCSPNEFVSNAENPKFISEDQQKLKELLEKTLKIKLSYNFLKKKIREVINRNSLLAYEARKRIMYEKRKLLSSDDKKVDESELYSQLKDFFIWEKGPGEITEKGCEFLLSFIKPDLWLTTAN